MFFRRQQPQQGRNLDLGAHKLGPQDGFIDITLSITPDEPGYDYSKLYYACAPREKYHEDRVICFRVLRSGPFEIHRIALPQTAREAGYIRLRLDALPYTAGVAEFRREVGRAPADDSAPASQRALRTALKQRTRAQVVESERTGRSDLPHMPESISLELTAGCNLTCAHCASHGIADNHGLNNRRKQFDIKMLDRLAADAFPSLTLCHLVGRGEPMMVGLPLWQRLMQHLAAYDVLMNVVTNGTFLTRRISAESMPVIDTLTASIDGMTQETFGANRGGASLAEWRRNLDYFNGLRDGSGLARRPRLGLSWTLKRNNIHQFPDFVRLAIELQADLLYIRHLFVFHEKDRPQSLVAEPELANRYLAEGYALLEGRNIKLDAVPLAAAVPA